MNKLRFLMPVGLLAVLAGFGLAVMLLWNWLMPTIFGLIEINFWQALCILVLCRILFGGFNFKHHHRGHGERMFGIHNNLREKWQKMTPEQRADFVNKRMSFEKERFFKRPEYDYFTKDEKTPKDCD